MSYPSGANHGRPSAKITEAQVREIRKRRAETGCHLIHLAEDFGIAENTVSNIINRKSWKHVD